MNEHTIINPLLTDGSLFLSNISVDNVIFGYHDKSLKVLLLHPTAIKKWALPGGYIYKDETIENAAIRVAKDRTGLDNLYFKQCKFYSDPNRTKDEEFNTQKLEDMTGYKLGKDHWIFNQHISSCFYTLTDYSKVTPQGDYYASECLWFSINDLPPLMFDHKKMIKDALDILRIHLYHFPVGYELLPEKFTIPEIHSLYETLLNKSLDVRNFTKKLLKVGIVDKLDERKNIGAHRAPFLYKFNKDVYQDALENGMALFI
ncbi:NUDIX hydrolase [Neptunitalea lumnitzerae]|uniref:NUDIX hydrolase n=1 Tax=Neptunitalea lumnitzerae TaxID=2965509 RepID=A0ABQ5MJI8_9FLAO|nr:NUDIX domain-containing protein [Neptunitalea sp. Y10]GLB49575.1 NUDIX hydrolase [Neptunitalea sp. Y10]